MGWDVQDQNPDAKVLVNGGYVKDLSRPDAIRTDFEIIDKTAPGGIEKTHLSIDANGTAHIWNGNPSILGS
jgi:hypothetical protein